MDHVSFVILHYLIYNDTKECILSILNNINYDNYSVIVVDNGSPNNSWDMLKKDFLGNPSVVLLHSEKNLGFAKGNNLGYDYAKEKFNSKFIIVLNNDTIIEQKDFISQIYNIYDKSSFYILGPDIICRDGGHQNPIRFMAMNKDAVKKLIKKYKKDYIRALFPDIKFLKNGLKKIEGTLLKKSAISSSNSENNKKADSIKLHGACLIFSELYIKASDFALYPETFMYMEEDILQYICVKNGYRMVYDPGIRIFHKEDASTDALLSSNTAKWRFKLKNHIYSAKVLYKLMKD